MKRIYSNLLAVFTILFLLCGSIYAQQLATVGKLFTKSEADKLYGSVIKSVSIGSTELYPAGIKKLLLMAHYLPWFQTPAINGFWGWHWTMNHYNPEVADSTGRRQIASHYYPLTGPYDSQDKDILEYQVLLMKISGIDGVLVDWGSNENFNDYVLNDKGTAAIFKYIQKAGLHFSIVYEDAYIKNMINAGHMKSSDALNYGKNLMNYLQNTWMYSDTYLKFGSRPVLLNFGPQYFYNSSNWDTLFSGLNQTPLFFTEDNPLFPAAVGAFSWVPMGKSNSSGILTQSDFIDYLNQFTQKSTNRSYKISCAVPGFHDIYSEAGVGSSYGYLDSQNGLTFSSSLQQAVSSNFDIIQLVTWNDYGEGTIIEPTVEFGYQYLEKIQEIKKASIDSTFKFGKDDLLLPLRIYQLRKNFTNNTNVNASLDQVFDMIVANNISNAKMIVDSLYKLESGK
jgi:hypothetical protein